MRARYFAAFFLLLAFLSMAFSACVNLSDNSTWGTAVTKTGNTYYIHESVTLCEDNYSIPVDCCDDAIEIDNDTLVFDCNESHIIGKGVNLSINTLLGNGDPNAGTAISLGHHSNLTIRNCRISGYSTGIMTSSNSDNVTIANSTFHSNVEGISFHLETSNLTISSNRFYNNVIDILFGLPSTSDKNGCYDVNIYNNTGYNSNPIFYSSDSQVHLTNGTYAELIFCGNDNISVENVTIQGSNETSSDGIFMTYVNNIIVNNVTFNNTRTGVEGYYGGHSFQMEECVINSTNLLYGVYTYSYGAGANNSACVKNNLIYTPTISNNLMSSYSGVAGILLEFANLTITNNTILFGNLYYGGIYVSSNHSVIANNTLNSTSLTRVNSILALESNNTYIFNNRLNYVNGTGISFGSVSTNASIFGNTLTYTYGVGMNISVDNVNIFNNTLNYTYGLALLLEHDISNFQPGNNYSITSNIISYVNGSGILVGGNNVNISNNNITASTILTPSFVTGWPSFAEFLLFSQNSTIFNNTITANHTDLSTLYLYNAVNTSLISNNISVGDGPFTIYFDVGSGGTIQGNTLSNASHGVYLTGISFYNILNNTIISKGDSIYLGTSNSGGTIHNSTFNNISYNNLCGAPTVGLYLDENTTNNTGEHNYGNMTDLGTNNTIEMLNCSLLNQPPSPPTPPKPKKHKKPLSINYTLKNSSLIVYVTSDGRDVWDAHVVLRQVDTPPDTPFYIKSSTTDDKGEVTFTLPYPAKYKISATKSGYKRAETTFTYTAPEKPKKAQPTYNLKLAWNYNTEKALLSIYTTLYKDNESINPTDVTVRISGENISYSGHPDSKGTITLSINQSGNYTIKATYKNISAQKMAEIILPTTQPQGGSSSSGGLSVNTTEKSLVISAPSQAYVGDKIIIHITYQDGSPASNINIKAVSDKGTWSLKTNEDGEATFIPPSAGSYMYTSNMPIKQTTTTLVKVRPEEKPTVHTKTVDFNVQSQAIIYVKPKVKGSYTAKVYLGNKLIMEKEGSGNETLELRNLPKGKYHVVVVSHKSIDNVGIEVANLGLEKAVSNYVIGGAILVVLALIVVIRYVVKRRGRRQSEKKGVNEEEGNEQAGVTRVAGEAEEPGNENPPTF